MKADFKATVGRYLSFVPCDSGVKTALERFDGKHTDETVLSIQEIWSSNGMYDAVWALRAIENRNAEIQLFACACARLILHTWEWEFPGDFRPRMAIYAAELYAIGIGTYDDLIIARHLVAEAEGMAKAVSVQAEMVWDKTKTREAYDLWIDKNAISMAVSASARVAGGFSPETTALRLVTLAQRSGEYVADLFRKLIGGGYAYGGR